MGVRVGMSAAASVNSSEDDEEEPSMLVPELASVHDGSAHRRTEARGGSRATTQANRAGGECAGEEGCIRQLSVVAYHGSGDASCRPRTGAQRSDADKSDETDRECAGKEAPIRQLSIVAYHGSGNASCRPGTGAPTEPSTTCASSSTVQDASGGIPAAPGSSRSLEKCR